MQRTALSLALLTLLSVAAPRAQEAAAPTLPAAWADALRWRSLGPANMGGRMVSLAVYETDPTIFWVATASGGLLKTSNGGSTFEHQFDKEATVSLGAVAVAPSDPQIVWVGTGENNPRNSVSYGDGVYKSVDGGKTWKHMGLRESFQTGDIVIHPTNPDIVWVGALGRLWGANEERGLYKTSDGGKTFKRVLFVDAHTGVIDIALHPADPQVLLVATYERARDGFDTNDPAKKIAPGSGLHRSTDGGETFTSVSGGLPSGKLGRIGLDWLRKDPNTVFAIVESEKIGMIGATVGWSGLETQDAEVGAKVTEVAKDSPAAKAGLAKDDIVIAVDGATVLTSRQLQEAIAARTVGTDVELEVARKDQSQTFKVALGERPPPQPERGERGGRRAGPDQPGGDRPFGEFLGGQQANANALQGDDGHEHGGVYRSDDAGVTWRRLNSINPRPMYFSKVRVDPSDDQLLYVLGISGARSKDGGKTFTGDFTRGVHADQHALWVDPRDGRHMLLGCDGGLYETRDRGEHWDHLNHTALGQFYHVAIGPQRDYWVFGGLQDNGSWGAPHRNAHGSGPVNESWLRVGGGDGFVCAVDAEDPEQVYYESQNGGMGRTHLRTMESGRIRPVPPRAQRGEERVEYRFNWRTPFALSHHNSKIFYCAGNHVFRSLNRGDDLKVVSPEITLTDRGSATAIAESPRDGDVLYVGTDDGALWGTRDGGKTWTDLLGPDPEASEAPSEAEPEPAARRAGGPSAQPAPRTGLRGLLPGPRWVASIEASRFETGRVYVALDAHRSDDDDPYVFASEDFGATWTALRGNLPRGSTRVVREDRVNRDLLWAGTEFGLYVSIDRGKSWTRWHGNLPTVAIHEVAQHASCGDVVLATHGRSLWAIDATPLRQLSAESIAAAARLYRPAEVVRWVTKHRHGDSGGARSFIGDNPRVEAELFFSLGKDASSVALSIRDAAGKVLRKLDAPAKAGLHRVTWDLRREMTEEDRAEGERRLRERFGDDWQRYQRFMRNRAPAAANGIYQVVLEVDGTALAQPIELQPDPAFPKGDGGSPWGDDFEDALVR
jgi:photosystem II stability/assembly factor-like uncharacterized protein